MVFMRAACAEYCGPPAFVSRVSNATVLDRAERQPLSLTLRTRQLTLFASLAQRPDTDIARRCVFVPGTTELVRHPLRRGRPVKTWGEDLRAEAVRVAGSEDALRLFLQPETPILEWRAAIHRHIFH